MNAQEIITRLRNLPKAFGQAKEIGQAMGRNSRQVSQEQVVEPRGRVRQMPRWAAAMQFTIPRGEPLPSSHQVDPNDTPGFLNITAIRRARHFLIENILQQVTTQDGVEALEDARVTTQLDNITRGWTKGDDPAETVSRSRGDASASRAPTAWKSS